MNDYIGKNIRFVIKGQRKIGSKKKREGKTWFVGKNNNNIYIYIESNFSS